MTEWPDAKPPDAEQPEAGQPEPEPEAREPEAGPPSGGMTDRQTYNVVTDMVTGPNVRLADNCIQGVAVLVCIVAGVALGVGLSPDEPILGVLLGVLGGLLVGGIGSGMVLMIYRAVQHARGRHD